MEKKYKSPMKKLKLKKVPSAQSATPSGMYESIMAEPAKGSKAELADIPLVDKKKKVLKKKKKVGFDRSHMNAAELKADTAKHRKKMLKKTR